MVTGTDELLGQHDRHETRDERSLRRLIHDEAVEVIRAVLAGKGVEELVSHDHRLRGEDDLRLPQKWLHQVLGFAPRDFAHPCVFIDHPPDVEVAGSRVCSGHVSVPDHRA